MCLRWKLDSCLVTVLLAACLQNQLQKLCYCHLPFRNLVSSKSREDNKSKLVSELEYNILVFDNFQTNHPCTMKTASSFFFSYKFPTINSSERVHISLLIDVILPSCCILFLFTCFANPVNVAVELSFELLLASKFEKGLSILYAFPLFGKFSESGRRKS